MSTHAGRVRYLYKTCLKLHRGLPEHLKTIGDVYVRDEFRRHKAVGDTEALIFMEAWSKYALTLARQLRAAGAQRQVRLGAGFNPEDIDHFSDEQLVQLHELYKEVSKPVIEH